jgi:hypothetical protein
MTDRDEIIRMARETGLQPYYDAQSIAIERFFALVVAAEREACAKTCEEFEDATDRLNRPSGYECAAAIRARGEK